MSASASKTAIVLPGGGARGAYEAGVLYYLMEKLPAHLGRPVRFQIVSGTSVGAIHACYLVTRAGEPGAFERLLDIWRSFEIESVYRLNPLDLLALPAKILGFRSRSHPVAPREPRAPVRIPGLLDASPLEELILREIPWSRISEKVAAGEVDAVAVAATQVRTGRSVIFIENREGRVAPWAHDPFILGRAVRIRPEHVLASAAIPFFFPAIQVDDSFYCDGSLRLNTPLSPALRLGAERVLTIGLRHQPAVGEALPPTPEESVASPAFLVGKILNALLLDRVDYDEERMRLFNKILEQGKRVYGEDFLDRINEPIVRDRGMPYRIVRDLFLRPSRDLGVLAAECFRERDPKRRPRSWLSRWFLRFASRNSGEEADFLSYLFFDGCYTRRLVELGIADAEAQRDRIVEFFGE